MVSRKIIGSALLLALAPVLVSAQGSPKTWVPSDTLPTDTAWHVGTLPNGLTYYIRHNDQPAHHEELRLLVRAGSLMETDHERGIAHFVEHMGFRGLAHFPGNSLVEYLESIGVGFGSDLNAQTSFDHTIYELPVPTDSLAQLKKALLVVDDWAQGRLMPPKDFEDERKIILGERRMDLGAGQRIDEKTWPVLLKGSKYPDRFPIGTLESVSTVSRDTVMGFFKKWYRADREAVIAVGDYDVKRMEQLIRAQFSDIPKPTTPLADPKFPIPPQPGTLVSAARDSEVTNSDIDVTYKGPGYPRFTVAAKRAELVRGLFEELMNERLHDLGENPHVPFNGGGVDKGDLMSPEVSTSEIHVSANDSGLVAGFRAVLTEVARADVYGFSPDELERAVKNDTAGYATQVAASKKYPSMFLVNAAAGNFLHHTPMVSVEDELVLDREILPKITLADIDWEAGFWDRGNNRVVVVTTPDKANVPPVDTAALLAAWPAVEGEVKAHTLAQYVDPGKVSGEAAAYGLLAQLPTPGTVVSEKQFPKVGITQWTLSNGVVVLAKPTTFTPHSVSFSAHKPGGWSVLGDSVFPTAMLADQVGNNSLVGPYNDLALQRVLTGKSASAMLSVDRDGEGVGGFAETKDLETALQVLYLRMTATSYDSVQVASFEEKMRTRLANRGADPEAVFRDTVSQTMSQHSVRDPMMSVALLDQIDPRRALALFRDRFADADGFTFFFMGDFQLDTLKALVTRYLGSLPALHRHEQIVDRPDFHAPPGVVKKTVAMGEEARTTTQIQFKGPYLDPSPANDATLEIMSQVLSNRLLNKLREQMGGTYSAGAGAGHEDAPVNEYTVGLGFSADPGRRAELTTAAFGVIDSLKKYPPTADELEKAISPYLHDRAQSRDGTDMFRGQTFWPEAVSLYEHGRSFDELVDDSVFQAVTPAEVQAAAQKYLDTTHHEEFDLVPGTAPSSGK